MLMVQWFFIFLVVWFIIGSILTSFLWGWKYSSYTTFQIFKGIVWGLLMGPIGLLYISKRKK